MCHITSEQRYTIEVLLSRGESQAFIAKTIGKSKSVISRELKRNCDKRNGQYKAHLAHRKYEKRTGERTQEEAVHRLGSSHR